MDELMIALDALWLCGVLSNKQRSNGVYQWQQRLLRLGRRIVAIERRARASARKQGKDDEVREATGDVAESAELEGAQPLVTEAEKFQPDRVAQITAQEKPVEKCKIIR